MEINNRRAKFEYFIEETFEAGIVLVGTEIKSLRLGNANLSDCYAIVKDNEVYLLNMYIGQYKEGNRFNHVETRTRKLLLHKKEIKKIASKINADGFTFIPLKVYLKHGLVKVLVGLAKGKKNYDKRQTIKERDIERSISREYKYK